MKKTGRPRGDNNKDRVCSIRMDEGTREKLEVYCRLNKKGKSEVIREAINMLVENSRDTR